MSNNKAHGTSHIFIAHWLNDSIIGMVISKHTIFTLLIAKSGHMLIPNFFSVSNDITWHDLANISEYGWFVWILRKFISYVDTYKLNISWYELVFALWMIVYGQVVLASFLLYPLIANHSCPVFLCYCFEVPKANLHLNNSLFWFLVEHDASSF